MASSRRNSSYSYRKSDGNVVVRALRAIVRAVGSFLSLVVDIIVAFFSWFGPFLKRLNAPLLHPRSRRRLLELFVVPVSLVYDEIVLRLFAGSSVFSGFGFVILFALAYGLLVDFIASFCTGTVYKVVMTAALFVACVLYAAESIIFESFLMYMTFSTIFAGAGDVVGKYGSTLLSSILGGIPRIIMFLLPVVLYVLANRNRNLRRPLQRQISVELIVLSLVFFLVGSVSANALAHEKYASKYEFNTAVETFGLPTSLGLDVRYSLFGNKAAESFAATETSESEEEEEEVDYDDNEMDIDFVALSQEETDEDLQDLDEYVASLSASSQNEYTGIFEGKNVILICAEAFSGAVISEELTPTLYRLQHEGIYFSDYYQPAWGGSTSSGEYSFLMGLVPTDLTESVADVAGNNNYFTLGNQLQREGYFTMAFHNGSYDYYDRDQTHYSLGYDIWLGNGNGIEDITGSYADDEETIAAMLEVFENEEPFCIYWMTVSGHAPYVSDTSDNTFVEDNLDRVIEVVGEDTYSDTVLYYLCYQLVLEDALSALVEGLEEAGIADDTVICLTSDHYPYGLCESTTYGNTVDYLGELLGDSYDISIPWERDQNALILWSGCLEDEYEDLAVEVSEPTYSLDILPTLSNMFGLEYDSRLLVGRDVFSDEDALVLWLDYSWKTERGTYDGSTGEFTPADGYEYDEEYVETINDIVANKITFSKLVASTDYYGTLFGEDDVGNDGSSGNLITTDELLAMAEAAEEEGTESESGDEEVVEDETTSDGSGDGGDGDDAETDVEDTG